MLLLYILVYSTHSCPANSMMYIISQAILDHLKEFKSFTIEEVANLCHISMSSISRYVVDIGYSSFKGFSSDLKECQVDYLKSSQAFFCNEKEIAKDTAAFLANLYDSINQMNSEDIYESVIQKIKNSRKIIIVGSPLPETISFFKMECEIQGIRCLCSIYPNDQLEFMNDINENDFVIVFDCFLHQSFYPVIMEKLPKIHFLSITCNPSSARIRKPDYQLVFPNNTLMYNIISASYITTNLMTYLQMI